MRARAWNFMLFVVAVLFVLSMIYWVGAALVHVYRRAGLPFGEMFLLVVFSVDGVAVVAGSAVDRIVKWRR